MGKGRSEQEQPASPLAPVPPAPVLAETLSDVRGLASLRPAAAAVRRGASVLADVGDPQGQAQAPRLGETDQGTDAVCPGLGVNSLPLWLCRLAHRIWEQVLDKVSTQGSCSRGPHCVSTSPPPFHHSEPGAPLLLELQRPQLPSASLLFLPSLNPGYEEEGNLLQQPPP